MDKDKEVQELRQLVKLFVQGWTVHKISMYDEEGRGRPFEYPVEGWMFESASGMEWAVMGDWDELPPLPEGLAHDG